VPGLCRRHAAFLYAFMVVCLLTCMLVSLLKNTCMYPCKGLTLTLKGLTLTLKGLTLTLKGLTLTPACMRVRNSRAHACMRVRKVTFRVHLWPRCIIAYTGV